MCDDLIDVFLTMLRFKICVAFQLELCLLLYIKNVETKNKNCPLFMQNKNLLLYDRWHKKQFENVIKLVKNLKISFETDQKQ